MAETLSEDMVKDLRAAVDWSSQQLRQFAKLRTEAVRQCAGYNYSEKGTADKVPWNLIGQYAMCYGRLLSAQNPKNLVHTDNLEMRDDAERLRLGLDKELTHMEFSVTLSKVVRDALFRIGIGKVALDRSVKIEIDGYLHDVGKPFFDVIDFDDFVCDMAAKDWESCDFIGHYYDRPKKWIQECGLYQNIDSIGSSDETRRGEKADSMSKTGQEKREFHPRVRLLDLWLPLENLIVTLEGTGNKVLRVVEWYGPERGPYEILSFGDLPGNLMPKPPIADLMDVHLSTNLLLNKIIRQGERQKSLGAANKRDAEDAKVIKDARDGELIGLKDVSAIKEISYGGPSQLNFPLVMQLKQLGNVLAGNLETLLGLAPQANTLGQEELISGSANKQVDFMRNQTVRFAKMNIEKIAWYLMDDQLTETPILDRVKGTQIEIPTIFSGASMRGSIADYDIDIEPYSLQPQSPSQRLQTLMMLIQNVIMPLGQQLQAQGIALDGEGLLRRLSQYADIKNLDALVHFAPEVQQQPAGGAGAAPANTTHESIRKNVGTATTKSADAEMLKAMGMPSMPAA